MEDDEFMKELADLLGPETMAEVNQLTAEINHIMDVADARRVAAGEETIREEADRLAREEGLDQHPDIQTRH